MTQEVSRGDILNLEERRRYWDQRVMRGPDAGHDLSDSVPYPFEPAIEMIFDKKDILEIGPGNGRQYERLYNRSRSYCICDISPNVLAEPVFAGAVGTVDGIHRRGGEGYLLESWEQSLERSFDVIHFWYVLHHICLNEMREFFAFVSRHLRHDGLVAFNCPELENVQGDRNGDGKGTTYSDPVIIREMILGLPLETLMVLPVMTKSTGFVFLLRRTC